jgi:NADH-quinone oxidoreductase subunit F
MLERLVEGEGTPMDLDIVASVQEKIIGHCLCVLGDSMAMPVGAMVRKFRGEFEALLESPTEGAQRIGTVQAPAVQIGAT